VVAAVKLAKALRVCIDTSIYDQQIRNEQKLGKGSQGMFMSLQIDNNTDRLGSGRASLQLGNTTDRQGVGGLGCCSGRIAK
jgi:hypothetical protein